MVMHIPMAWSRTGVGANVGEWLSGHIRSCVFPLLKISVIGTFKYPRPLGQITRQSGWKSQHRTECLRMRNPPYILHPFLRSSDLLRPIGRRNLYYPPPATSNIADLNGGREKRGNKRSLDLKTCIIEKTIYPHLIATTKGDAPRGHRSEKKTHPPPRR